MFELGLKVDPKNKDLVAAKAALVKSAGTTGKKATKKKH